MKKAAPCTSSNNDPCHSGMKHTHKQFIYYPFREYSNSYPQNFKTIIEELGYSEVKTSMPKLLISRLFKKPADLTIVNWIENDIVSSNGKISPLGIITVFASIFILKLSAKKVFYVKHNEHPHKTIAKHIKIAKIITTKVEQAFNGSVIIHSPPHSTNSRHYIPHPLYALTPHGGVTKKQGYYVLFGRIIKYKNIAELLNKVPGNIHLIIAGYCADESYLAKIKSISGKNTTILERDMNDNEAAQLVKNSQGLIISHATDNTIVSGSFFFAISLGVKVFALETIFFNYINKQHIYKDLHTYPNLDKLTAGLQNHIKKPTDFSRNIEDSERNFGNAIVGKMLSNTINK